MNFTHKLAKRLALIKSSIVLGLALSACTVERSVVSNPQITQLVVVPNSVTVTSNQTFQFEAFGRNEADDSIPTDVRSLAWSTSNTNVATVSSSGVITGRAAGTVTITAMATGSGKSATASVVVTAPPPGTHAGWHVTPSGSSSGNGSTGQPWSLTHALAGASGQILPGDTVWLHGGTYRGKFSATVAGTSGRPVVIRQYPGERAIIDVAGSTSTTGRGDAFIVRGEWTVWWGVEMMSSDPNRYTDTRPNMIVNNASNTKYVHIVVHDGGIGFFNYPSRSNVEIVGSIFYNNGWQGPAKGGGHALYLKSYTGPVTVRDNIIFNQFGYGVHVYTDAGAGALVNLTVDGNVSFNNGSVTNQYNTAAQANILMGGEEPVSGARVLNNMTYFSPGYGRYNLMMGYSTTANSDLTLQNNYSAGGTYVATFGYWNRVTATGNRFIGSSRVVQVKDTTLSGYDWTLNNYQRDPAAAAWTYNGTDYTFGSWKTSTGLGVTDVAASGAPGTPEVFVKASAYEDGRATIVVYNWGGQSSVPVDLTGILGAGSRYEVRNVQDYFGSPVTSGTYAGGSLILPMGGVTPPAVVGGAPHAPPRTGPDFDVFVVTKLN